ncbi:MAG: lysylphosphatidylglycerol synthase transmembrane domain-containing protein [Candidatus Heimdallarchaeota archaeon]
MPSITFSRRSMILTVIALILVIIYFSFLGPKDVLEELAKVSLWIILAIVIVQLTGYFLDSLAWKLLLQTTDIKPSIKDIYSVYITSFGYGLLVPSMSAVETAIRVDLGKQAFEKANHSDKPVDSSAILSSIVLHKMLGGIVNIPVNIVIAYSLVVYFDLPTSVGLTFMMFTTIALGIFLFLVIAISLSPDKTNRTLKGLLHGLTKILPPVAKRKATWEDKLEEFIFDYHTNFKFLARHWKQAISAGILILLAILVSWVTLYLLIIGLSADVEILAMIAVNFIGASLNVLPLGIPGMEGIKEIVVAEALQKFLDSHERGAIALLYSFAKFVVPVTAAILVGLFLGAETSDLQKTTEKT